LFLESVWSCPFTIAQSAGAVTEQQRCIGNFVTFWRKSLDKQIFADFAMFARFEGIRGSAR
jgi:hypothetical protein